MQDVDVRTQPLDEVTKVEDLDAVKARNGGGAGELRSLAGDGRDPVDDEAAGAAERPDAQTDGGAGLQAVQLTWYH